MIIEFARIPDRFMKKNEFVEYVVLSNINLVFPSLDVTLCLYNSVALSAKKISLYSVFIKV